MKITEIIVRNIKKVVFAIVTPKAIGTTIIGGENEAGKSSLLDGLSMCLGGKKLCPSEPIRKGEETGFVSVKLDGGHPLLPYPCTVTRTFERLADGSIKSELEILDEDGLKSPAPQSILDEIITSAAYDPLAFTNMKPKEQQECMRELLGLDFTEVDRKYEKAYNQRKFLNREVKDLEATISSMQFYDDCPDEVESVVALVREKESIQKHNQENDQVRRKLTDFLDAVRNGVNNCEAAQASIDELEKQLAVAKQHKETTGDVLKGKKNACDDQEAKIEALDDNVSTDEIQTRIENAEATNNKVRSNTERKKKLQYLKEVKSEAKSLTDTIDSCDKEKTEMSNNAEWPIDGMGFSDNGITVNNLPFDQASSAQQLAVSTMIGLEKNKGLPFLIIKNGSLLGNQKLLEIAATAASRNAQVFIERVGEGEECQVIMRDGVVVQEEVLTK